MKDFSQVWLELLQSIKTGGKLVSPRGQPTIELQQKTIEVDMRKPVLKVPARQLSYRFMAAEAYWILSGDDRVETIARYNQRIAAFSDDGERFFGAYGPKIVDQLPYIVEKLAQDPSSRQAGLIIWREKPPVTKDVPCTVAIFFSIRGLMLNCHVFMRSSDAWLGVPYDVFNFSMLSHLVCARLNASSDAVHIHIIEPGTLFLTAASSHLYERDWQAAGECMLLLLQPTSAEQVNTPMDYFLNEDRLMGDLAKLRETYSGDPLRWWEMQA